MNESANSRHLPGLVLAISLLIVSLLTTVPSDARLLLLQAVLQRRADRQNRLEVEAVGFLPIVSLTTGRSWNVTWLLFDSAAPAAAVLRRLTTPAVHRQSSTP